MKKNCFSKSQSSRADESDEDGFVARGDEITDGAAAPEGDEVETGAGDASAFLDDERERALSVLFRTSLEDLAVRSTGDCLLPLPSDTDAV